MRTLHFSRGITIPKLTVVVLQSPNKLFKTGYLLKKIYIYS